MAVLMGPVLSFRGYDPAASLWNLTAVVVANAAPGDLTVTGQAGSSQAESLWKVGGRTAYRYTFSLTVQAQPANATYQVAGESFVVALPAAGIAPRMAFATCNGFSALKLMKGVKEPNALWKKMAEKHASSPYQLLLLGGDQVYADSMWEIDGPMKDWLAESWDAGNAATAPPKMRKWLDDFFFGLYTERWAQPEVRALFASVPTVAMWDDHDLIDGWGSYEVERQTSEVFGAIWKSASKAFAVFQQHLKDGQLHPNAIGTQRPGIQLPITQGAFSFGHVIGPVAIVALDMRSQRNKETQVIGADHWNEIYDWIDKVPVDVSHLIVMSSIPVVYPGFDTVELLLGLFPGHQDLEDDLRDHWNSAPHREERLRLIQRLLRMRKETRPLIVSGDVHVAALGVVESISRPQSIQSAVNQLISSGIVHPGPGAIVLLALRGLFDSDQEIERGVVARMMKFPNSSTKFVGNRNFLSLEPDTDRPRPRLWAHWLVENEAFPLTKVIDPNPLP